MGLTYVAGKVASSTGKQMDVRFLVDSGAVYTLLPSDVWQDLGLEPQESMAFTLADGTAIERKVSECQMTLFGRTAHSPVILGEPGDEALLGMVTLEIFALVLDPFKRTLQPMRMRLACNGPG